jgi:hypothetical protein
MYTQTVRVFSPMGYLVGVGTKITYEEWTVVGDQLGELARRDIKTTDSYGEAIFLNANETYYRLIYGERCRLKHGFGIGYVPEGGLADLWLDIKSCSEQTEHFATALDLLMSYDTDMDGFYNRGEAITMLMDLIMGVVINESEGAFCWEYLQLNYDQQTEEIFQNISITDWCASLPVPGGNAKILLLLSGMGVIGAIAMAGGG